MSLLRSVFLATLALGLAGIFATPSYAGGRYDSGCNCYLPDSAFKARRTVQEGPRYVPGNTRVVNTRKVVPRYRTVEENQLEVHVRPVVRKEVVLHRQHIHYQNIITKRVNTINRFREELVNGGVSNRYATTTSSSTVVRVVHGSNCNCGGSERVPVGYREATYRF